MFSLFSNHSKDIAIGCSGAQWVALLIKNRKTKLNRDEKTGLRQSDFHIILFLKVKECN